MTVRAASLLFIHQQNVSVQSRVTFSTIQLCALYARFERDRGKVHSSKIEVFRPLFSLSIPRMGILCTFGN